MNWDALSAIGEIVGAIAVVATLIYFSRQMKQNTTMLRSQARRQVLEGVTSDTERVLLNQPLTDVWKKHTRNESLDEKEEFIWFGLFLSFLGNLEIQFHEIRDGSLDPMFEDTLRFRLSTILDEQGDEQWASARGYFTQVFQDYVDEQLNDGRLKEVDAKNTISLSKTSNDP